MPEETIYAFGDFRLDAGRRLLAHRTQGAVPITSRAFDTLLHLVRNPERLVTKRELMNAVWGDAVVEENNLTQTISTLRQLLGERPDEHRFIVTVPGRGYRFIAPVTTDGTTEPTAHAAHPPPTVGELLRLVVGGLVVVLGIAWFLTGRFATKPPICDQDDRRAAVQAAGAGIRRSRTRARDGRHAHCSPRQRRRHRRSASELSAQVHRARTGRTRRRPRARRRRRSRRKHPAQRRRAARDDTPAPRQRRLIGLDRQARPALEQSLRHAGQARGAGGRRARAAPHQRGARTAHSSPHAETPMPIAPTCSAVTTSSNSSCRKSRRASNTSIARSSRTRNTRWRTKDSRRPIAR